MLSGQQRVYSNRLRIVIFTNHTLTLRIIHKIIDDIGCRPLERGEEAKHRIDCRMIQKLVLRVINLSDIRCRLAYSTSDSNDNERYQQECHYGAYQLMAVGF